VGTTGFLANASSICGRWRRTIFSDCQCHHRRSWRTIFLSYRLSGRDIFSDCPCHHRRSWRTVFLSYRLSGRDIFTDCPCHHRRSWRTVFLSYHLSGRDITPDTAALCARELRPRKNTVTTEGTATILEAIAVGTTGFLANASSICGRWRRTIFSDCQCHHRRPWRTVFLSLRVTGDHRRLWHTGFLSFHLSGYDIVTHTVA